MPKSKLQLFTRALHIFITIFYSHTIDAPFPSMLAIYRMNKYLSRIITWRTQIIKIFSIVISVGAIAIMSFIFLFQHGVIFQTQHALIKMCWAQIYQSHPKIF